MREYICSRLERFLHSSRFAKTYFVVVIGLLVLGSFTIVSQFNDLRANPGPYLADDMVGQLNGDNTPNYTQSNDNNNSTSVSASGFSKPSGAVLDASGHRLFVSETTNNRIVVFNLSSTNDISGVDRTADNVLCQANFSGNSAGTTVSTCSSPNGLAFDATNQRLFVADSTNNRVLVFDVTAITNGENAVNVLGQAGFTSASAATTAGGLSNPKALAYDSSNSRLFVADTSNHRVLIYNVSVIGDGEDAVNVLCQANFITGSSGTTQSKCKLPIGLAYDSAGSRLFVSDQLNNRVLAFSTGSISDGADAASVLGQTDFITGSSGTTQATLNTTQGLAYDTTNKYLFVSDGTNNRIMIFDVAAITNGENAVNALGQTSFTAGSSGLTQSTLNLPKAPAFDPTNRYLYVPEENNNRVMIFAFAKISTSTLTNGELNASYSQTISTAKSQGTVTFAVSSGSLPTGLSLNSSTGVISGTPTATGSSAFTIQATDTVDLGTFLFPQALTLTVADTVAPTPTSISASSLSQTGATIAWSTTEASSSQVEYGLTNAYGASTTEADTSTRVTSHSVTLSGLTAGTTYHYRVKSKDAADNQGVSSDQTFITVASVRSSDSTPPGPATNISGRYDGKAITLQWTNPSAGDLSKIEVWRNSSGNSVVSFMTAVASSISKLVDTEGLEADKTYTYQLVTVDIVGNKSLSQEAAISTASVATVIPAVAVCGNKLCESGETALSCPADCAPSTPLEPKLELTLRVNVSAQDGTVITANRREGGAPFAQAEGKLSLTFALALSLLMMGAFLIHTHTTGLEKNPMSFFAIVPLLFASSSTSYQYLRKCGPESCQGPHFTRHKVLKHFSRATLAATVLTGVLKLLVVLVISSVIPNPPDSYAQAMSLRPGDHMTAELTVRNTGTGRATNVLASLGCPVGLTLTQSSVKINGNSSTINPCSGVPFVDLSAGGAHTIEAVFIVEQSAVGIGALSLRASATSAETGTTPVSSNAISFSVVPAPEPAPLPEPQPQPELQPRRQPQPQPEFELQPKLEPKSEPQPQPAPRPISGPTSQSRGLIGTPPLVAPEFSETAPNFSAVHFNISWSKGVFAGAVSAGEVAGLVPLSFTAQGPLPSGAIRVEMVVQSDPQIFPCPITDDTFRCQVSAALPFGRHTLFAQAMHQDGTRTRISNVVEFEVKLPACFDALDNDSDTLTDYPDDPGCTDRTDDDELEPIAVALEPVVSEPVKEAIARTVANIQTSKAYQTLDKKVLNNPVVEKANVQVAAPVIVAAAAANTATAVATAGVSLASILTYLQGFLTQPLLLFTRRRRKQWGVAYSSLAKVPVDLALVRLFGVPSGATNISAGRLMQTRVTDKQGRYLFIASPGMYRIEVTKPGFTFPSTYLKGKTADLDFADLYHGGLLTITSSSTITRPIPLDPVEKVQTSGEVLSRKRKRFIQTGLAYSGPLFAIASVAITPTLTTTALLGFQFLMLGLFKRLAQGSKPRSFARVRDGQTGKPIAFAVARIFDSTFNKLLETQITDKDGRYGFLVGRGTFYITVEKPGYGPYRSETMDLTKAESAEIVKRDIRLKPGSGTPPQSMGSAALNVPPSEGQAPALQGGPSAVGVPLVKNPSQADWPKNGKNGNVQKHANGNGNAKINGKKNGNGKMHGNGYGHA